MNNPTDLAELRKQIRSAIDEFGTDGATNRVMFLVDDYIASNYTPKGDVLDAQIKTEHYWITYYGRQRRLLDGSDGDMAEIRELKRHMWLHKDRLAELQAQKQKEETV